MAFLVGGAAAQQGKRVPMFLNARVAGATPLLERIGDGATVFSY